MSNFASGYLKYISHLEEINEGALSCPERMISEIEESYRGHLRSIAADLLHHYKDARIIMLSGPSSSGKTTTASLLGEFLANFGRRSYLVSLDDFYRGRANLPLLPNGKPDYESLAALDTEKITACLKSAVAQGRLVVPVYDFVDGVQQGEREIHVGEKDMVIVEGLHALNPVFTRELPEGAAVKIYVSVKQEIKDANSYAIGAGDIRLVRRIVRDVRFRGSSAEKTISMWPEVEEGEDRYIRPYRTAADYTVNSIHLYEPCVLRTVAIPLLRQIAPDSLCYRRARDLESRLMRFEPISPDLVPEGSMLREFLGELGVRSEE